MQKGLEGACGPAEGRRQKAKRAFAKAFRTSTPFSPQAIGNGAKLRQIPLTRIGV